MQSGKSHVSQKQINFLKKIIVSLILIWSYMKLISKLNFVSYASNMWWPQSKALLF